MNFNLKFSYKTIIVVTLVSLFAFSSGLAQEKRNLEIASFTGGYNELAQVKKVAAEYEKVNENVEVEVWGGPRVWEKVRPRIISGDPPDLAAPSFGFDFWSAIYEGEVMPLDEALESSAYDQDKPWKDTFVEGALTPYKYDGHTWIMPLFLNIEGWWYDEANFEEHGWEPPETWEETLSLSESIKEAGIAPFANQGTYPFYALWSHFIPYAVRIGGVEALEDAINLEPGAWNSEPFLEAAQAVETLVERDYFQKGHLGMNHTESQMEVLLGRAAMIGCGTWLPSEMRKSTPESVKLRYTTYPTFKDGEGDPTTMQIDGDLSTAFIVPSKADNPDLAIDFLKFMTSKDMAKLITEETNAYLSVKSGAQWVTSESVLGAVEDMKKAKHRYNVRDTVKAWYPQLWDTMQNKMTNLLSGKITAESFVDQIEAKAKEVRNDEDVVMHHYEVK